VTALAASAGLVLDRLLGEPPTRWHPVAWFGTTMNAVETRWWVNDRRRGVAYAATGIAVGLAPALLLRRVVGPPIATIVASGLTIAAAMLEREAHAVAHHLAADDIASARTQVGRLVGRTTGDLETTEVSRAVIETVAENTVDAVTATVFWATVAGAPGALMHRSINTMDAMVGHRSERHQRFGWASARLDDFSNWAPARLTALAVIVAAPNRAGAIVRTVRRDAHRHPSPNGGVVEAAFAAALGVRLGGTNVYGDVVDDRGILGDGRPPIPTDIERATALAQRAAIVFAVGCTTAELVVSRWARHARIIERSGRLTR
jgi:adenosylcobinamide-phosphate synthase